MKLKRILLLALCMTLTMGSVMTACRPTPAPDGETADGTSATETPTSPGNTEDVTENSTENGTEEEDEPVIEPTLTGP